MFNFICRGFAGKFTCIFWSVRRPLIAKKDFLLSCIRVWAVPANLKRNSLDICDTEPCSNSCSQRRSLTKQSPTSGSQEQSYRKEHLRNFAVLSSAGTHQHSARSESLQTRGPTEAFKVIVCQHCAEKAPLLFSSRDFYSPRVCPTFVFREEIERYESEVHDLSAKLRLQNALSGVDGETAALATGLCIRCAENEALLPSSYGSNNKETIDKLTKYVAHAFDGLIHTAFVLPGFPPHLENLEKQGQTWKTWKNRGFWGKNLEKYYKTWKKILTSPWKSPKDSTEKVSKKKAQARGPRVFFVYLDKGLGIIGFY